MTITRLKAKNQITIPKEVVNRLNLKPNELFCVELEDNYIKLIPVDVEPRYTTRELQAIEGIVERQKPRAKAVKPGKEFSGYIKKIAG